MTPDMILPIFMRWTHVLSAIALVGGFIFLRFAVLPALKSLSQEDRTAFIEGLVAKWRMIGRLLIALILVSGLYNFMRNVSNHEGQSVYHAVFGVKFLLAFLVFFLGEAMNGKKSWTARFRTNLPFWSNAAIAVAVVIVFLSAILRILPVVTGAEPAGL